MVKNHFRHEGFWMTVCILGPVVVGLAVTIVVQTVRGAQIRHAARVVSRPASTISP
jgi:uncharacterized integral membrane protein